VTDIGTGLGLMPAHSHTPIELIEELTFYVEGHPAPQGSKKHVGNGRMVEMSKRLPMWRAAIVTKAVEVLAGRDGFDRDDPIYCGLQFFIPRGSTVRREYPTVAPDVDKLERAVLDALTDAKVWGDDAQVVSGTRGKRYADECPPGVRITIRRAA
jgi:crossover junction endodeoxyribonuclease RusA